MMHEESQCAHVSRRDFLKGVAVGAGGISVAATLPGIAEAAKTEPPPGEMIIDLEHHLPLQGLIKGPSPSGLAVERNRGAKGNIGLRQYEAAGSVEYHLKFMGDSGIDVAVLTSNTEGGVEGSRKWHDMCAGVVKKYPERFVGFACISPLGGELALEELERAVKELGMKGVHITASSGGHTMDSKEYWPFYEKVSELKIPIDVHINASPQGFDALNAPYPLYYITAREFDICAATLRICLGGVLKDFPDLTFIINHFGGGVSTMLERVDAYASYAGPGWSGFYPGEPLIDKPYREYFNKLYFNMAGREEGIETVNCALTNINPKKLLFGTDFPYNFDLHPELVRKYVSDIRKLRLPEEDKRGMLGDNAAQLLGIKKRG